MKILQFHVPQREFKNKFQAHTGVSGCSPWLSKHYTLNNFTCHFMKVLNAALNAEQCLGIFFLGGHQWDQWAGKVSAFYYYLLLYHVTAGREEETRNNTWMQRWGRSAQEMLAGGKGKVRIHLNRYKAESCVGVNTCPLQLWSLHMRAHGKLTHIAQRYLATPPSTETVLTCRPYYRKGRSVLTTESVNRIVWPEKLLKRKGLWMMVWLQPHCTGEDNAWRKHL